MKISNVKTNIIKCCSFYLNNSSGALLSCRWYIDKNIQNQNNSRIYFIVVDDIIKKIGGSGCKGGIKSTLSFYNSANQGKPSISRFGIQKLIIESLEKNKIVDVYLMFIDSVEINIQGLNEIKKCKVNISFKEMESLCIDDYVKIERCYPEWNYQESGNPWPKVIQESYIKHRKGV